MIVKTNRDHLAPLVETLQNRHPYDCPEIVAVPIVGGSVDYLGWLAGSLAASTS
jgi:periplasmic divalent cation tolerance protein